MKVKIAIRVGIYFFVGYFILSIITIIFFNGWAPKSMFKSIMRYLMEHPLFLNNIFEPNSIHNTLLNISFWTLVVFMLTLIIVNRKCLIKCLPRSG